MHWTKFEFDDWIESGHPKTDGVISLDLSYNERTFIPAEIGQLTSLKRLCLAKNKLESLPSELWNLTSLLGLDISRNRLTLIPAEIGQLTLLKVLCLSNNDIAFLPAEIGQCHELRSLYLHSNSIAFIPAEIGKLVALQSLDIFDNQLTFLPAEIGKLVALQNLNLSNNKLTFLPVEIGELVSLQILAVSINQLTFLPVEIGKLVNLQSLYLSINQLTTLPSSLGNCIHIYQLSFSNNPIEYIPPNVRRLINNAQGIYTDHQSVHNSGIQTSIKDSIMRLLSVKPTYDFEGVTALVLSDQTLTQFTKESLVEYCKDESVHTILNLTFSDLLTAVWNRIVANENATEIKAVLNTEMMDAECKCFTGRISRLVNCLNGFDSSITITINDNEQIGNIVLLVKEKLIASVEGYSPAKHRELVRAQLEERGYTEDVIKEWIDYIE